jgi:quinoprotein glucose dehydrogenase
MHIMGVLLGALLGTVCAHAGESTDGTVAPVGKLKPFKRQAEPEVAPASDEAASALKRMKLAAGLKASLWAAEPMLANPVAINFDERGRLFVSETYRYKTSTLDIRDYLWMLEDDLASRSIEDRMAMLKKHFGDEGVKQLSVEGEVVRVLEDRDHDGKADTSRIYADGFRSPLDGIASGVLARRDQVWFSAIPSLWMMKGAERAETRTELSRGYGIRFSYTGHDLHGLVFGPDGRIYFSVGDRGAHVPTKEGGLVDVPDCGAVFRCYPDGSGLEVFATGLRNPQSLVFTEYGDLLTGDNDSDLGDSERLLHVVEGGDYGWRIGYQHAPLGKTGPWNAEKLWMPRFAGQPAYVLAPICNIEDGPSGITYYPGTGLSPEYASSVFITHFKGAISRSGIQTYSVKPHGASYAIVDSKTVLTNSLPTDVKFGPDGRLYYSDWAEGWPKSKRGRIYAIYDPAHVNDPLVKETERLINEGMEKRGSDELARLLGHPDWRVRLEAQYTLAERGAESFPILSRVATHADEAPSARLHAVWALGQLAAKKNDDALSVIGGLINDRTPEIRAQSAKLLGDNRVASASAALIAHLEDPNARVRFFAAQSLGKLGRPEGTAPLLALLRKNHDEDDFVRHAAIIGLAGCRDVGALAAAADDRDDAVRLGALLALRRLGRAEVSKFLSDSNPLLVAEAARAINDAPINDALPALAALIQHPTSDEPLMLRVLNANFRLGTPVQAVALANYAAREDAPPKLRAEALNQLAAWPRPPARDRLVGIYRPLTPKLRDGAVAIDALRAVLPKLLAGYSPSTVQTATLAALQSLEVKSSADALFAVLRDERQPDETRVEALNKLEHFKYRKLAEAVRIASQSRSSSLRLAALPIAARLSPEASAPVLVNLVEHGQVEEQKAAIAALAKLGDPRADALLAEELRKLAAGQLAAPVQLDVIEAAAQRQNGEVKQLLASREAELTKSVDPLARFRIALEGGDKERGKQIFQGHPVLACVRCHQVAGEGGEAGPDLSAAGVKYSRDYLLESVIKPNAKIAPGFETTVITLKDGTTRSGTLSGEDEASVSVKLPDNSVAKIAKADIGKRETAPSAMPEIFGQILSKTELRDLIEYLSSLNEKAAPPSGPRALQSASNATD